MNAIAYTVGYYTGVTVRVSALILMALFALLAGKTRRRSCQYDERQTAARGTSFTTGFLALLIYFSLYAAADSFGFTWCAKNSVGIFIGLFVGVTAFSLAAITNDAYFGLNENRRLSVLLLAAAAGISFLFGVIPLVSGSTKLFENGLVGNSELSFLIAALYLLILAALLIHRKKSLKTTEEDS